MMVTAAVCLSVMAGIEFVPQFPYLGSIMHRDGRADEDVRSRIAKASRAFHGLLDPIFRNTTLSLHVKCHVYKAVVLTTLLYGAETWTIMADHIRQLNVFHHQCARLILGISRQQQLCQRLSSLELARAFGVETDMVDIVREHRLRWLGHVARMSDDRTPKCVLFGELPSTRPQHGPKKRWRDCVVGDLSSCNVPLSSWMESAMDRPAWRSVCHRRPAGALPPVPPSFHCHCGRSFRRSGDLKRHQNFCGL